MRDSSVWCIWGQILLIPPKQLHKRAKPAAVGADYECEAMPMTVWVL